MDRKRNRTRIDRIMIEEKTVKELRKTQKFTLDRLLEYQELISKHEKTIINLIKNKTTPSHEFIDEGQKLLKTTDKLCKEYKEISTLLSTRKKRDEKTNIRE